MADEKAGTRPGRDDATLDDFYLLCTKYFDGATTPDEVARLESILRDREDLRDDFVDLAGQIGAVAEFGVLDEVSWPPRVVQPRREPTPPGAERRSYGAVAVVAVGLLAVVLGIVFLPPRDTHEQAQVPEEQPQQQVLGAVVAHVEPGAVDGSEESVELREGGRWELETGRRDVLFDSSVRVVLLAPFTTSEWAKDGFRLERGRIAVYVPPAGQGFAVTTPRGRVVDHGTEFGIHVDEKTAVDVDVFDGRVAVHAPTGRRDLSAGDGLAVSPEDVVSARPADRSGYVVVPRVASDDRVDLVDVLCGGDGNDGRRNRAVDVRLGTLVEEPPAEWHARVAPAYHPVEDLERVDGVFVPDGGDGPVVVDSSGNTFDGFPDTAGTTYGVLFGGTWSPNTLVDDERETVGTTIGGRDHAGDALLDMHANKAVTFDLDRLRADRPGHRLLRFTALAGNSEVNSARLESGSAALARADLFVLVDGEERFGRRAFNATDGAFSVVVPLAEDDRFLTIASTDAGNGAHATWVLLVDPVVETERAEDTLGR